MSAADAAYRSDIDGLRAVAIALVLGYHAFPEAVPAGFIGVDVFFVISGYLITRLILRAEAGAGFSIAEFYVRRIRRIFPALTLVLAACLGAAWLLLLAPQAVQLSKHVAAGAFFVSNFALAREVDYFDVAAELKPLLHLWSLSIEEQFYLAWPLLFLAVRRLRVNVLLAVAALLAVSFVLNAAHVRLDPAGVFFSPLTRGWELLVGCGLACLRLPARPGVAGALSIAGSACLVAALCAIDRKTAYPGWAALLPVLGTAFLIAAGGESWLNRQVFGHRFMVFVGLISYPLYLWHYPLLSLARYYDLDPPSAISRGLLLAASVALAWATYEWLEKPIRSSTGSRGRRIAALLALATLLIGAAGYALYALNRSAAAGDPSLHVMRQRIPEAARPLLAFDYPFRAEFRSGTCMLSGPENAFAPGCVDADHAPGRPLMVIWGDSHGAMYYRALDALRARHGFSLAQFTSSSCPPLFDFDKDERPLCRPLNDFVRAELARLRPATVILGHDWPQSSNQNSLAKLPDTVAALRKLGVQNIVLVGPAPRWRMDLPRLLVRTMVAERLESVPARIRLTSDVVEPLDREMARIAASLGLQYVSPYRRLCNAEGCLVATEGSGGVITSFDNSHLTQPAAAMVIGESLEKLLPGKQVLPGG